MRIVNVLVMVCLCTLMGATVFAQGGPPSGGAQAPASGGAPGGAGAGGNSASMDDVDATLTTLASQLSLSDSQKAQAKSILEDRQKQILKVREDFPVAKAGSNPSQEGIAAMTKMMKDSHAKMLTILTDDQKKKYEEIDVVSPGGGPSAGPEQAK